MNVVCFLLEKSPGSEFYTPTFGNPLHRQVGMKKEETVTPWNYAEESIRNFVKFTNMKCTPGSTQGTVAYLHSS